MPSKIQQSAMGLGSRYPLFENDFMQHGVRLHFRSTDSTQIIESLKKMLNLSAGKSLDYNAAGKSSTNIYIL